MKILVLFAFFIALMIIPFAYADVTLDKISYTHTNGTDISIPFISPLILSNIDNNEKIKFYGSSSNVTGVVLLIDDVVTGGDKIKSDGNWKRGTTDMVMGSYTISAHDESQNIFHFGSIEIQAPAAIPFDLLQIEIPELASQSEHRSESEELQYQAAIIIIGLVDRIVQAENDIMSIFSSITQLNQTTSQIIYDIDNIENNLDTVEIKISGMVTDMELMELKMDMMGNDDINGIVSISERSITSTMMNVTVSEISGDDPTDHNIEFLVTNGTGTVHIFVKERDGEWDPIGRGVDVNIFSNAAIYHEFHKSDESGAHRFVYGELHQQQFLIIDDISGVELIYQFTKYEPQDTALEITINLDKTEYNSGDEISVSGTSNKRNNFYFIMEDSLGRGIVFDSVNFDNVFFNSTSPATVFSYQYNTTENIESGQYVIYIYSSHKQQEITSEKILITIS